jgi:hypothetical protein
MPRMLLPVWAQRRLGISLDIGLGYETVPVWGRAYCVFTHLQTLEPSLYPRIILLQYALNSLA